MRATGRLSLFAALALAVVALAAPHARGAGQGPVLHEPIPPDPREDIAMQVAVDGDLPAALDTKSGVVHAPDPRKPVAPSDSAYGAEPPGERTGSDATFRPDRDTKRPDVQGYDDPFTPSTAPFKRLEAFDSVSDTYELYVRDKKLVPVPVGVLGAAEPNEEQFYADLVVDVSPARKVRIPSVGPGARILRARLGIGSDDLPVRVWRDGADNWFLESLGPAAKARLVIELSIARGAWGGDFADASWSELPRVAPLPPRVMAAAAEVQSAIGVSTKLRPRDNVMRLVRYFRSFADSEQPPTGRGDIYLDLALSKKGVCRHRAFAFLITAQSLGLPTRMVINEAHAWVEVHDGVMWRRIDLGGAGRMVNPASSVVPERPAYQPPPDSFAWPQGAERGDDMVEEARQRARGTGEGPGPGRDARGAAPGASASSSGPAPSFEPPAAASGASTVGGVESAPSPSASGASGWGGDKDDRPSSTITVSLVDPDAHRGMPLHVRGGVRAEGEPCAGVVVELYLRDGKGKLILLGASATNDSGDYAGSIVVPGGTPLGDYDVIARTQGDARCGQGSGP